jgi:hypothetical protein
MGVLTKIWDILTRAKDEINGSFVTVDWLHHLVHDGKLHRVNCKIEGVSSGTGCNFIISVPIGTELHWNATYWAKFGGVLDASYNPTSVTLGTEITPINCYTKLPNSLQSKFYHTNTATAGPAFTSVGISGGTAVAGNGSSGGSNERAELILKAGLWYILIKPFADSAVIIMNAEVYEETIW